VVSVGSQPDVTVGPHRQKCNSFHADQISRATSTDTGAPATPPPSFPGILSELLEESIIASQGWKMRAHEVFRIHWLPSSRHPKPQSSPVTLTSLPRMRLIAYFDPKQTVEVPSDRGLAAQRPWEAIQ